MNGVDRNDLDTSKIPDGTFSFRIFPAVFSIRKNACFFAGPLRRATPVP